jgi:LCP family protein required for cell wall assembly
MSGEDQRRGPVGRRTRQRRQLRGETLRSLGLTTLAVVPGAGLTRTRYRLFGWILLSLFVLGVVALALLVTAKGALNTVLSLAVSQDLLLAVAGLSIFGGLVWIFSIILTHRGTEPANADPGLQRGLRLFTALICLVVAAPMVQVVRYAAIQRGVVDTVFAGSSTPKVKGTAAPDGAADDPWKGVTRVNMLLVGSDAGSDREGIRTDSMIVASINPQTGNTTLISIPRNLERVPFSASNPLHQLYPNGYSCPDAKPGAECLINAVWKTAEDNRALFKNDKNPGLTALRDAIEQVTGLKMDYSTVIDLDGFSKLVDAMGGVMVDVKERLPIGGKVDASGRLRGETGWVEQGYQRLDGFHALWYARSRVLSDDFDRMRRQRCLIGIIVAQVNPVMMLSKYPALAQVAQDNIWTDLAANELPAWVNLVQRMQRGTISSLTFTADNINTARPDFAKMRLLVQAAISPPATPSSVTTTKPTTPPSTATTRPGPSTSTTRPPDGDAPVDVRDAC